MTRKLLTCISLFMIIGLSIFVLWQTPVTAQSSIVDSGSCGKNLSWTLDTSGTLTIAGAGAMKNYAKRSDVPWYSLLSEISSIMMGNGVISIGDYAFSGCKNLVTVTIPDGITSIGDYAFLW